MMLVGLRPERLEENRAHGVFAAFAQRGLHIVFGVAEQARADLAVGR